MLNKHYITLAASYILNGPLISMIPASFAFIKHSMYIQVFNFQSKENISKEAVALKESLNIARSRSEWLESHMTDSKDELQRLRVVRKFPIVLHVLYH